MQHAYLVWFEASQQVSHAVNAAIPRLPDLSQVPHGTLHDLREGRGGGGGRGEGRGGQGSRHVILELYAATHH